MNPRGFLALLVVTSIAVIGAVVVVLGQPETAPVRFVDEPAFPALRDDPDAVARIVLSTPEGVFTLVRESGDRWLAEERSGYPVDAEEVRRLVVALADMRLIEAKTSEAERYQRLEVENVDTSNAKSKRVRLEAADGTILAEAIIGKQRQRRTGTEASGTYLRRPGEMATWLASGSVRIEPAVVDWLEDEIVDLDAERIHRIEIRPADGAPYAVVRDAPGQALRLENPAVDEALDEGADLASLAHALTGARLEDVQPDVGQPWPEAGHSALVTTFDGLELTVELAEIEDQPWARFEARDVEPLAAPVESPGAAMEATAEAGADANATGAPPAESTMAMDEAASSEDSTAVADGGSESPEEAVAATEEALPDAATLNQRLGGWTFRVPQTFFDRLTTPRDAFLRGGDGTS